MEIRESLEGLFTDAINAAIDSGQLQLDATPEPSLERPRDEANGDWASTVAMRTAKLAHMAPRDVAQIIVDNISKNDLIANIEIAGPGFINITLNDNVLQDVVACVRRENLDFGKSVIEDGKNRINLEYISANPTGPMHVGHGRWATLGDALARVMRHAGYDVYEEFYINDHGTQMDIFAKSVSVRYMQLLGHEAEMPENSYGGEYVSALAQEIIDEYSNAFESMPEEERDLELREIAYPKMIENQKALLARYGVTFDRWFSERDLYAAADGDESAIDKALRVMTEKGYVYKKEDATWFASTEFGDEKDRVLIKANGEYTYFMSDVAYHYDKVCRGYDKLIDIWGADHHGYVKRCEAMLAAWGYPDRLEIVLGQLVNLYRDGKPVRMSKRTGEMITFEELVDEVGVDSTRFMMLSRSSDQQIDFDIDQAKKQDSANPVYYVQYAHARICSILRKTAGEKADEDALAGRISMEELVDSVCPQDVCLDMLTHKSELALMRFISTFKETIALAARDRAPFRLTHYSTELASLFHGFYTECRVISDDESLTKARIALCDATRITLEITLSLMGISAPLQM